MKRLKKILVYLGMAAAVAIPSACSDDNPGPIPPSDDEPTDIERGTFAKGADVSWLTQLEAAGEKFYTPVGTRILRSKRYSTSCVGQSR